MRPCRLRALLQSGPTPPSRPSITALLGLNPDAPAPEWRPPPVPASASPQMLAALLAQQPNGVAGQLANV